MHACVFVFVFVCVCMCARARRVLRTHRKASRKDACAHARTHALPPARKRARWRRTRARTCTRTHAHAHAHAHARTRTHAQEAGLCRRYGVESYPSLKYWTGGDPAPKDYVGVRTLDVLRSFAAVPHTHTHTRARAHTHTHSTNVEHTRTHKMQGREQLS